MRDVADNFVVICAIENIDPMGSTPAIASPWRRS
jgi:carbamoylphosphate synthase large subunit